MNQRLLSEQDQQFYSPFSTVLLKAEEEGGKWTLYLQASNEGLDQEEEVILCKALKDAAPYYLSHGVLSWDHKHKALHDPGYIIGEPMDVAFNEKNETLVKGFLYKSNKIAQNLWDNIQSGAKKLGASVGGGILKKAVGKISKVIWDETAITHKPINDGTLGNVSVIPFAAFAKALMSNVNTFTNNRTLTFENLQGITNHIQNNPNSINYEELRPLFDNLLVNIAQRKIESHSDIAQYLLRKGYDSEVTLTLMEFLRNKIPALAG